MDSKLILIRALAFAATNQRVFGIANGLSSAKKLCARLDRSLAEPFEMDCRMHYLALANILPGKTMNFGKISRIISSVSQTKSSAAVSIEHLSLCCRQTLSSVDGFHSTPLHSQLNSICRKRPIYLSARNLFDILCNSTASQSFSFEMTIARPTMLTKSSKSVTFATNYFSRFGRLAIKLNRNLLLKIMQWRRFFS